MTPDKPKLVFFFDEAHLLFKDAPAEFLSMITVHELAHLREREHDKAFYKLCTYMEPRYHQLEFEVHEDLDPPGPAYARGGRSGRRQFRRR